MKFRSYEQHQTTLLPQSIEELVPEDHIVRVIDLVVEQLDLKKLYKSYSEEGQPAYHPKMLLKILYYGYSMGVRSSRKIAEHLESDIFFMYLSAQQRPDFRTISDFRLNKLECIIEYFQQVLLICRQMGLAKLGHVAIDGTKVEANSSRRKMYDKEYLLKVESRLEERIKEILNEAEETDKIEDEKYGENKRGDELPEELSTKEKLLEKIKQAKKHLEENNLKRVSITDPQSRVMLMNNKGTDVCYNAQAAIDVEDQIIVECQISNKEDDHGNFEVVYEKVKTNTSSTPKEVSADAGYYSGKTYLYLEKEAIDAYLPDCKLNSETDENGHEIIGDYDRRKFKYNKEDDSYSCPENKRLKFKTRNKKNDVSFKVYKGQSCCDCAKRKECLSKESVKYREIQIYENDEFKQKMRDKLLSEEGKKKYQKRMIIEAVFAHLKRSMQFRQFLLRAIEKTNCELRLICTAYNIKKMSKFLSLNPQ